MRYFLRRRNRQHDDNPTWPGLVDVFAFGMALMVVLYALQGSEKGVLEAEVKRQEGIVAEIRDYQGKKIRELYQSLCLKNPELAGTCVLDTVANVIHIDSIGGKPIEFESAKWKIADEDSVRLHNVVTYIALEMEAFLHAALRINGTADPRPLLKSDCLEDNIELSAMRAAAVARVINANPRKIDKSRVRVVGLGEEGREDITGLSRAQVDSVYQKYRTVRMDIYIDVNAMRAGAGRK